MYFTDMLLGDYEPRWHLCHHCHPLDKQKSKLLRCNLSLWNPPLLPELHAIVCVQDAPTFYRLHPFHFLMDRDCRVVQASIECATPKQLHTEFNYEKHNLFSSRG